MAVVHHEKVNRKTPHKSDSKKARLARSYRPDSAIEALHRGLGNQALQRMLAEGTIQARLKVGTPNDKYEQEADRLAEQVLRMPVSANIDRGQGGDKPGRCALTDHTDVRLQTKHIAQQITPLAQQHKQSGGVPQKEDNHSRPYVRRVGHVIRRPINQMRDEEEMLQAKVASHGMPEITSNLGVKIQSLRGGGRSLPESARGFFEPRFRHDFSQVRIHNDSHAADLARGINARAFTIGRDVVFGTGQYSPENAAGRQLLAHELTHVIQQGAIDRPSPRYELDSRTWIQRTPVQSVSPDFHFGEFSGHDEATDDELLAQLAEGDVSFWDIYQDNKAREIVRRWLTPAYPHFRHLSRENRILLIRQMLSGATLDDDERAILELLSQDITNSEGRAIVSTVGRDELESNLHGEEDDELRRILRGMQAGDEQAEVAQCTQPGGEEPSPQCEVGRPASAFHFSDSAVAEAIFSGLATATTPNPFRCDVRRAIIELLPQSSTFLEVAQTVEHNYFCAAEGGGLTFEFHAEPETGSHFARAESSISIEEADRTRENDRIELIRTLVHEIVHASHGEIEAEGSRRGRLARFVEKQIGEEAATRARENQIMLELVGSDAWRTLVGNQISTTELQQSEEDVATIRRDFASGIPRLTYVEKYIIEASLAQAEGELTDNMPELARRAIRLRLVPETVRPANVRSFDFQNPRTLGRPLPRPESCPAAPPTPPTAAAPTAATGQVAIPRNIQACLQPYYNLGRRVTHLEMSHRVFRGLNQECRAFIQYYRNSVDGNFYREYSQAAQQRTLPEFWTRLAARMETLRRTRAAPTVSPEQRAAAQAEAERQACLVRNRDLELANRQKQEVIDLASGDNREYFEWYLIRLLISNEWVGIPETAGGERTAEVDARIRTIQDEHLTFLRNRIGEPLRGYTYEGLPARRPRRKKARGRRR